MGSQSDWPTLRHAAATLDRLGVPHERRIVSAHRTPDRLADAASVVTERTQTNHPPIAARFTFIPTLTANGLKSCRKI